MAPMQGELLLDAMRAEVAYRAEELHKAGRRAGTRGAAGGPPAGRRSRPRAPARTTPIRCGPHAEARVGE